MYKAVVFDLDGTLLNTLDDLADSVNYALGECGFAERSLDEIRSFVGNGVVTLIHRSVPEGTDEQAFEKCFSAFRARYLEHMYDKTRPYEGIAPLLEHLKAHGIKTAVVSNKLHEAVVQLCEKYFPGLITCAFGVADESERKPSPANVQKVLSALGVDRSETVYIGDSEVDILTAKNAGLDFIGVLWGFRSRTELELGGAARLIGEPAELWTRAFVKPCP